MDDLDKLEQDLKRMEKFPTRYLTGAVKKGAKIILAATKQNAPFKSGALRNALIVKMEKSKTTGKRVAEITYDSASNEKLVKMSKVGGRSYYPASQEFGFIMRNGQKKEGLHFMRNSADAKEGDFDKAVIDEMMGKIEKAWRS